MMPILAKRCALILSLLLSISASYASDATFPNGQRVDPAIPIAKHNTLRVINQCSYPIWVHTQGWVRQSGASSDAFLQDTLEIAHGNALDYSIPASGAHATLTRASAGCDPSGNHCAIGSDDVNTLFEVSWDSIASGARLVPDLSAVEGFTFPVKVTYTERGANKIEDCGQLSLLDCPNNFYDHQGAGPFDERVSSKGQIVGCYSNKKINPQTKDQAIFIKDHDLEYYGCPAPLSPDVCHTHYGVDPADRSARTLTDTTPAFVQYLHQYGKYRGTMDKSCQIYSYAYDDNFGSLDADADQPITLTYCPDPSNEPALPTPAIATH